MDTTSMVSKGERQRKPYEPTTPATSADGLPLMLTVTQCAELAASSSRHVLNLIHSGEIKATRVGSSWRVPRDFYLSYLCLK